jgi:hypothetical protein
MNHPSYSQWRFGYSRRFEFGLDEMSYRAKDYSGERAFSTPYEAIHVSQRETITITSHQFINRMYGAAVVLFICFIIASPNRISLASMLFFWASLLLVVAINVAQWFNGFRVKLTHMTVAMPPEGGLGRRVSIIGDRHHDVILNEIVCRWRTRLRALYGAVDLENDIDQEMAKFAWLKKMGVIDTAAHDLAIAQLQAAQIRSATEEAAKNSLN